MWRAFCFAYDGQGRPVGGGDMEGEPSMRRGREGHHVGKKEHCGMGVRTAIFAAGENEPCFKELRKVS